MMAVAAPRSAPAGPPYTPLLLVGINALWGGSSVAAKAALAYVPPMFLAFTRFALSALLLYALAGALRVDLRVARRDWGLFWAIGAVGICLTYVCAYAGLRATTAADSALIHAAEPLFLTVLSVLMLRERLPRGKMLATAAGLAGVLLIVSRSGHGLRLTGAAGGDLLIALGLLFEALSVILSKRLVARYPPLTVLTYQMLTGAVLLAPCAAWVAARTGWTLPAECWTWSVFWSLLYLILPCTVLGYTIWFLLLGTHRASDMSVFLFIQPVFGATLGVVFQHDPLTLATLAGAALVLLALVLLHRRTPDIEWPTA